MLHIERVSESGARTRGESLLTYFHAKNYVTVVFLRPDGTEVALKALDKPAWKTLTLRYQDNQLKVTLEP